jgi:hypothetical protein
MRYDRALRFLSNLKRLDPPAEMIFELFYPADDRFFRAIQDSVRSWSLQITLESGDEHLRRINGKLPWPNAAIEASMRGALVHGCKLVFFMTAPHCATTTSGDRRACEHLMRDLGAGGRLHPFIAPLGRFSTRAAGRSRTRVRLPQLPPHAGGAPAALPPMAGRACSYGRTG